MEHISKNQIKLVRSLQQKKFRDESGLFVAEGEKCVKELRNSFELYLLINSQNATTREIEQMSGLKTPQGTIGIFKKRENSVHHQSTKLLLNDLAQNATTRLILALDSVQDPGNLGTIIRTADWFGISDIICSYDTADCYNPKVVQATMGSLARVNLHYTSLPEFLKSQHAETPVYGTLLDGKNIYEEQLSNRGIIIMGNEGNGISNEVRKLITFPLSIPSFNPGEHAESLNVGIATALTLSEFRRR